MCANRFVRCGRTAVVGAGMIPGLSDLLPQVLASLRFQRANRMTAWLGGVGRFTETAGFDYLRSLHDGFGEANAANPSALTFTARQPRSRRPPK